MLPITDFSRPDVFLLAIAVCCGVVIFRYLLVAGTFYFFFYYWRPQRWTARKINPKPHSPGQYRKEIRWSLITSLLFGVTGAFIAWGWQRDVFKIYEDTYVYGLWYLPVSILIAMLLQETYYYWIHRLMHHKSLYRLVHQVHHDSHIASPWTSFSFHPLEGMLQAAFLPAILLFLPMHPAALVIYLTIMTISSAINHLDIEIYPARFGQHRVGRWLIGATHHSLHHKQFRYNYGLYFTFWDQWMGTESPLYKKLFAEKTKKPAQ